LTGINGTNGLSGASGLTALFVVSQELPGTNCTTGGSRVSAGFDANRDNVLDASEVSSASFVCNGFNGSEGANGNVGATGAAGANGTAGATGAAGTDGATGATGVTGSAGANGLAGATGATGATGAAGATGSAGNDGAAGATGNAGVAGVAGSNGATGAIGLESLVTIVTELPGIPCLSGGVVAKSGVDSNANNSLDALEVTSTTYICNGERGAIGATGATGATGGAGATGAQGEAGATGATGPAGGGLSAFGYFYTLSGQLIPVGSAVVFDSQSDLLNIEFGIAKTDIKILASRNYLVHFSVTGTESNQFALKVNMVVVPGSIYGSGADTQQNNEQVILHLGEGDVVNLVNYHSAAVVGLQSLSGGTETNVTASISLLKLN
jgi:hypothetical protein